MTPSQQIKLQLKSSLLTCCITTAVVPSNQHANVTNNQHSRVKREETDCYPFPNKGTRTQSTKCKNCAVITERKGWKDKQFFCAWNPGLSVVTRRRNTSTQHCNKTMSTSDVTVQLCCNQKPTSGCVRWLTQRWLTSTTAIFQLRNSKSFQRTDDIHSSRSSEETATKFSLM